MLGNEFSEGAGFACILDEAVLKQLFGGRALRKDAGTISDPVKSTDHRSKRRLTSFGSLIKHKLTKSLNALEKEPSSSGARALGMRNKTRIG